MSPSKKNKLNLKLSLKEGHLRLLKQELKRCFPNLSDTEFLELKMTRNPFRLNKDILSEDLQKEFSKIKCNSTEKKNFKAMSLTYFWAKYVHIYKIQVQ